MAFSISSKTQGTLPSALHNGGKLWLLEALRNELPARSQAIHLKQILAAKWGRGTFVWSGRDLPGVLLLRCSHKFELPRFDSSPLAKGF